VVVIKALRSCKGCRFWRLTFRRRRRRFSVAALRFVKRVFRAAGVASSLLAVLLASGGQWMVLQSVAWARMLGAYSRDRTLVEALSKTFDGKHPCRMCHQIREGQDRERREPSLVNTDRAPGDCLAIVVVAFNPPLPLVDPLSSETPTPQSEFPLAPPAPPPRAA